MLAEKKGTLTNEEGKKKVSVDCDELVAGQYRNCRANNMHPSALPSPPSSPPRTCLCREIMAEMSPPNRTNLKRQTVVRKPIEHRSPGAKYRLSQPYHSNTGECHAREMRGYVRTDSTDCTLEPRVWTHRHTCYSGGSSVADSNRAASMPA